MNRLQRNGLYATIGVATLAVVAVFLGQSGTMSTATPAPVASSHTASAVAAPTAARPSPNPVVATSTAKAIYKGHTLEEILADPVLLAEVRALSDYIRPIHGEPDPRPTMASNAFFVARLVLMAITGSNCESSHEGQLALDSIGFEGMAARLSPEGGVLEDSRGWLGTIDDARDHFGGAAFVAEDPGEHWFITDDPATLDLLFAKAGPAAAALIEVTLVDGRTVWYLGPRWFVSIPC